MKSESALRVPQASSPLPLGGEGSGVRGFFTGKGHVTPSPQPLSPKAERGSRTLPPFRTALAFLAALLSLAAGCSGGGGSQKPPYQLPPDPVEFLVLSPKGGPLVVAANQTLKFWDLSRIKEAEGIIIAAGESLVRSVAQAHASRITSLAVSADGVHVASGCYDRSIKLWDSKTAKEIVTLPGHRAPVTALALSPDGKLLASGAGDPNPFLGRDNAPETDNVRTELKLWDLETHKPLADLKGHGSPISGVVFSHDGRTLISTSLDGTIKLWNVNETKAIRTTQGRQPEVKSLALSPDGKTLALACHMHKTVRLWDLDSWKEKAMLTGHTDRVNAVAFSPAGDLLASASDDETVIIWDLATVKPKTTLKGHTNYVNAVVFTPDGRSLVSGGIDSVLRLWDVAKGEVRQQLK